MFRHGSIERSAERVKGSLIETDPRFPPVVCSRASPPQKKSRRAGGGGHAEKLEAERRIVRVRLVLILATRGPGLPPHSAHKLVERERREQADI